MSVLLRASQVIQGSNEIFVESGQIIVGRLPSNHLAIPGVEVEPIHAMIEIDDTTGDALLVDMASEVGIRVNGKVIEVSTKLKPGDLIQIGKVRIEVLDPKVVEQEKAKAAVPPPIPPSRSTVVADAVNPNPVSPTGSRQQQQDAPRHQVTQRVDAIIRENVPTAGDASAKRSATARVSYGGIFTPGKERSVGSTLEIVAFWDQSILDVRHYGGRWQKGDEPRSGEVYIGNETDGHLIGIGPKASTRNLHFASVSESKSTIFLDKDMKARVRRGPNFERMAGPGKFSLSNKEIAIVKHGPVHYFLQNVSMPNPVLKRFEDIDGKPIIFWFAALLWALVSVGIYIVSRELPDDLKLDDDPWAQTLTIRTPTPKPTAIPAAKPPVELPKPTPLPSTPKPTPPPKEPVKVTTPVPQPVKALEKPKVPQPVPITNAGVTKGEVKNAKDNALGRKNNTNTKGNSGGAKGGTSGAMAGQRQGEQKTDQMGVEKGKQNTLSGINLDELGAGVGKVMDINAVGAIATGLKSSAGGAGAGSGSGAKGSHGFGGMGNQNSLSTGGPARALSGLGGGAGGLGAGGLGGSGGDGQGSKIKAQAVVVPESDPAVDGGLTREEIEAVIRANLAQIKACYERNLQGDRGLAGRVKVDFTVSPNGQVAAASIAQSTLGSPATENCITGAIRRWKFPLPRNNSRVQVSYPFVFSSR